MTIENDRVLRRRHRADKAAKRGMLNAMLMAARPDLGRAERLRAIAEMMAVNLRSN